MRVILNKLVNFLAPVFDLGVYVLGIKTGPALIHWLKG